MKTRRLMIGLLFAVGMSSLLLYRPAYAKDLYGAISYQISMPTGDTQNFVDNTSYAGVGLDIRRVVRPNVTLGLFFGWNVFHEHSSEPININTGNIAGTVTGKQSRTLTSIPMMVNASYYFGQRGGIRPYVGLNLGGFVFTTNFRSEFLRRTTRAGIGEWLPKSEWSFRWTTIWPYWSARNTIMPSPASP